MRPEIDWQFLIGVIVGALLATALNVIWFEKNFWLLPKERRRKT